jgi:hypothetical protein
MDSLKPELVAIDSKDMTSHSNRFKYFEHNIPDFSYSSTYTQIKDNNNEKVFSKE